MLEPSSASARTHSAISVKACKCFFIRASIFGFPGAPAAGPNARTHSAISVKACKCFFINELQLTEGKASAHMGAPLEQKISTPIHFPLSHYTAGYIVLVVIPDGEENGSLVSLMRGRVNSVAVVPLLLFLTGNQLPNSWGCIAELHSIFFTAALGLQGSAAQYIIRSGVLPFMKTAFYNTALCLTLTMHAAPLQSHAYTRPFHSQTSRNHFIVGEVHPQIPRDRYSRCPRDSTLSKKHD